MNNEEKWLEELSAYLDGEASDARGVEELVRREPALARRSEDYTRLGALLRSLPEPDVHPAFVTRVVAHAVEAGPAPAWRWWQVLVPAFSCVVIALVALSVWQAQPTTNPQLASQAPSQPENITLRKDWTDEESVVGAMETLIDQGVVLEVYAGEDGVEVASEVETETTVEIPAVSTEPLTAEWGKEIARDVYAYVSDSYWLAPESEVLWFRPDADQEYETLSPPEQQRFMELLRAYQENG